jgi:hypothetical protein
MTLGQFIATYHTEVSLVLGPLLVFSLFRWSPLPAWGNVVAALGLMFFAIGLWGIILNWWVLLALTVWLLAKRRAGLRVLRYVTLGLAVLMLVAAAGFYLYLLFANPGEFFRGIGNPLMYLYALPGVLLFILSQHIAEKAESSSSAGASGSVDVGPGNG